jgi:hypothetical protein
MRGRRRDDIASYACEPTVSNFERCKSACETGVSEESTLLRRVDDEFRAERAPMRVAIAIAPRILRVTRSRVPSGFGNFAVVR